MIQTKTKQTMTSSSLLQYAHRDPERVFSSWKIILRRTKTRLPVHKQKRVSDALHEDQRVKLRHSFEKRNVRVVRREKRHLYLHGSDGRTRDMYYCFGR